MTRNLPLTAKQASFIARMANHGDMAKAVLEAGYSTKEPLQTARRLIEMSPHVAKAIEKINKERQG